MSFAIGTADYNVTGWLRSTGANYYSLIDEEPASDVDYMYANIDGITESWDGGVTLTKDSGTATSASVKVRARCFETDMGMGTPTTELNVRLLDNGGTIRQQWTVTLSNAGYTDYTLNLDATGLTHFNSSSAPKLTFIPSSSSATFSEVVRVSYARITFTTSAGVSSRRRGGVMVL